VAADLVVLETFTREMDANLVRSVLAAAGIESMIAADDAGGVYPMLHATRGLKLLVAVCDVDAARRALAESIEPDPPFPDDAGPAGGSA
jgi:hypothetical protein